MQIYQLLSSTWISGGGIIPSERRRPGYVFRHRPFGNIYALNKKAAFKNTHYDDPKRIIVELALTLGVATEKNRSAHRCVISLKGLDAKVVTSDELVKLVLKEDERILKGIPTVNMRQGGYSAKRIKQRQELLKRREEFIKTKGEDILKNIVKEVKFFENKSVFQKGNSNDFVIVEDKIPLTAEIKCSCSCSDYYFSYMYYNADHGCQIGPKPPKYRKYIGLDKEEQKSLQPIRNPNKKPGVCKHLLLFIALLMQNEALEENDFILSSFNKNVSRFKIMNRQDITKLENKLRQELAQVNRERKQQRIDVAKAEAKIKRTRAEEDVLRRLLS